MAESSARHRLADAVASARRPEPKTHEVAQALFDEHLDLAAIRKALGQPLRSPDTHPLAEMPPLAAKPAADLPDAAAVDTAGPEDAPAGDGRAREELAVPAAAARAHRFPRRSLAAFAATLAVAVGLWASLASPTVEAVAPQAPPATSAPAPYRPEPVASLASAPPPLGTLQTITAAPLMAPGVDDAPSQANDPVRVEAQIAVARAVEPVRTAPVGAVDPVVPTNFSAWPAPSLHRTSLEPNPDTVGIAPVAIAVAQIPTRDPGTLAPRPRTSVPAGASVPDQPGAASTRIVIHYHRSRADSFRPDLTAALRRAGFSRVEWRAVPDTVSQSQTRYFHDVDRSLSAKAQAVLAASGLPAQARDFRHFDPPARTGTVEVWLSD